MVITNLDTDTDHENNFISIDLSHDTQPNWILDFYEQLNAATNEYEYTIQAQWMEHDNYPRLKIDEKVFLDFAEAIQRTAQKILNR
jgi:hypothetical protein